MTTLKDLSRHLKLSVTQVSRALNDHDDVSQATKERVQKAAKLLNYRVNMSAKRLVTGRSGIVGLVVEQDGDVLEPQLFTQVIWGLSHAFSERGRQFILHATGAGGDVLREYESLIDSAGIDGFVITEPTLNDRRIAYLINRKVPFVVHGRVPDHTDYAFYDIDNFAVGHDLTRYLIDRGHQRIAFLNGPANRTYVEARREGYVAALTGAGLALDQTLHITGDMAATAGLVSCIRLFDKDNVSPTAIVCSNITLAEGAYAGLKALGLAVPDDVSVVAHDDLLPGHAATSFTPPLTTTMVPLSKGWPPIADLLSREIDGAPLEQVQMVESMDLIERGSVRTL
ncbi:LacI family DNA-binding transcriptional regulator [Palleronia caenipelagi]|uniref:LacI family DNA-binding transcriptional regulator n=1 Tax=Palleronia caenipelagi TaxID=2489174 RepID=UPI001C8F3F16|nr:substrate-binding domain-containing protein [Palleronia caenipelagi]